MQNEENKMPSKPLFDRCGGGRWSKEVTEEGNEIRRIRKNSAFHFHDWRPKTPKIKNHTKARPPTTNK